MIPHRTDEHQNKHSHVEIVGSNDASKVTSSRPAPVAEMKHLDGQESDEASETDCSNELIPEVLEKNQLTHLPKPSVDTRQVGNTNATAKKNITDKKESNKKEYTAVSAVLTDSSLSDSDSDVITTSKPIKGGAKTNGEQPKSSPKRKMTRKAVQEQQMFVIATTGSGDKTKDNTNSLPVTATRKLRTKRKYLEDDAQGPVTSFSEKRAKKRISKKELELANTSSQTMILDNEKLWTE